MTQQSKSIIQTNPIDSIIERALLTDAGDEDFLSEEELKYYLGL